ncbi:molecular chaperone [Pantoea sp. B9002]|uniref:fimbrial biogenesis chaperone n=1 Tax=Pantoea sp. B9002 TaxID=2726979 RepID=UPI0015A36B35|nr:molecular chaperone [Pantoea sp. B9002]NWA62461.1 molecular chaperone [Pantoea sp. B9002]
MKIARFLIPIIASLVLSSSLLSSPALADGKGGFSLGSTRVIYNGEQKDATITVINSAKNAPFLAQTWIDNYEENKNSKPPFVVTPPLYRQDQGKNTLRIIRNGGDLPLDRESVFWLNVKAIPAQSKENQNKNTLSFAYVLKVKLFYRPESLTSSSNNAYKELSFSQVGNKLIATNSTPYYITINKLSLGQSEVKNVTDMVPPFGKQSYALPEKASGKTVSFRVLNDMGGIMPEERKSLVN